MPEPLGFAVHPGAERVVGGAGVGGLDADGGGHEVAPAFAHAAGFEDAEAAAVGRTAGQPVREAVRVLVDDDAGFERAVAHRAGVIPEVHSHSRAHPIDRGGKIGIVDSRPILSVENHEILSEAALVVVIDLKVTGGFGEAELVEQIVVLICSVKELGYRGIAVAVGISQIGAVGVDELFIGGIGSRVRDVLLGVVPICLSYAIILSINLVSG